jgi:hypothetical protein
MMPTVRPRPWWECAGQNSRRADALQRRQVLEPIRFRIKFHVPEFAIEPNPFFEFSASKSFFKRAKADSKASGLPLRPLRLCARTSSCRSRVSRFISPDFHSRSGRQIDGRFQKATPQLRKRYLPSGRKRAWNQEKPSEQPLCQRITGTDWKKVLENGWNRKKITKRPTRVVGKQPHGKSQLQFRRPDQPGCAG